MLLNFWAIYKGTLIMTRNKNGKQKTLSSFLVFFMAFTLTTSLFAKSMNLEIGGAEVLKFKENVSEVFIASPEIADVQVSNQHTVYAFGKTVGSTSLFVMDEKGREILRTNIVVTPSLGELKELIAAYDTQGLVEIKFIPGGLLLEGVVDSPVTAENIRALAEKFMGAKSDYSIINRLTIKAPTQVNLRVKVAEVTRGVLNQLGFNWQAAFSNIGDFNFATLINRAPFTTNPAATNPFATATTSTLTQAIATEPGASISALAGGFQNSHVNLNTAIDLLSRDGLVTILAEPNLVAVSGETASFLAGGEFPYPVPQQFNNITIEFKQYGVSLAFTPTVLDGNLISMRVRPEVSELDPNTGIRLFDITVPGILTRRAETTVQLGSGQTFAIAGLLKNTVVSQINSLPGLGDIPILGALFRSNSFKRGDSELVILVTPYIVEPVAGKEMASPLDGLNYATFVEQIVEQRLVKQSPKKGQAPDFGPGGVRLVGPAGFSM